MPKYIKMPKDPEIVIAYQWNSDNSQIPECTNASCPAHGLLRHAHTLSGVVGEGEWVVSSEDGDLVLSDAEFSAQYLAVQDRLKVKTLAKTCSLCPSQWEGTLEDGRLLYIRSRHDYLSVRVSEQMSDDIMDAVQGNEIFGTISDAYATKDMIEETKTILDFSNTDITGALDDMWESSTVELKPFTEDNK